MRARNDRGKVEKKERWRGGGRDVQCNLGVGEYADIIIKFQNTCIMSIRQTAGYI
jgi:hypothetical protein